MRIITFCSFKGGTAKTSSSLNIGCCLSIRFNKKVLFIDADPQANLTSGLGVITKKNQLLHDLLNGKVEVRDTINKTKFPNIDIISSSMLLDDLLYCRQSDYIENSLKFHLSKIHDSYDICIIDTPPNFGFLTKSSFEASDDLILCSTLDPLSILGISKMKEFLDKMISASPCVFGIVLSFWDKRNATNQMYIDIIDSVFPNKVFESKIRRDVYISRSFLKENPVFLSYPTSRGASDFMLLSNEIYEKLKMTESCEV